MAARSSPSMLRAWARPAGRQRGPGGRPPQHDRRGVVEALATASRTISSSRTPRRAAARDCHRLPHQRRAGLHEGLGDELLALFRRQDRGQGLAHRQQPVGEEGQVEAAEEEQRQPTQASSNMPMGGAPALSRMPTPGCWCWCPPGCRCRRRSTRRTAGSAASRPAPQGARQRQHRRQEDHDHRRVVDERRDHGHHEHEQQQEAR